MDFHAAFLRVRLTVARVGAAEREELGNLAVDVDFLSVLAISLSVDTEGDARTLPLLLLGEALTFFVGSSEPSSALFLLIALVVLFAASMLFCTDVLSSSFASFAVSFPLALAASIARSISSRSILLASDEDGAELTLAKLKPFV